MYSIAHVVVGTHLPWNATEARAVAVALVKANLDRYREANESDEDLLNAAEADEIPDLFDDEDNGWHTAYHGGGNSPVAWVGEEIDSFDDTDHFDVSKLTLAPSSVQHAKARAFYDALPDTVRELLPPFGVYVVWSSS